MTKRSRSAVAILILLSAIAPLRAEVIEQVVVKINGDIVTKSEFETRQIAALRARQDLANAGPDSPVLKRAIEEVTPQLILDAVDELLMVQRGRELGYALGDDQFKSILDNIKKQNNLEDETRFQAALKQEGMTMADLRRSLEKQMMVSRVQQAEVVNRISITDDEAKAYYADHKSEFTTPASITLREILIDVPVTDQGVNVAADDEAKQKAEGLRSRLLAGEPFPRLAAEASDAASRANGGLIGPISYTELSPALQQLVDGMKVGDLSQPLRTQRGYQLLKLEAKSETKVRTFDEARNDIGDRIGEQKMRGERDKYLTKLRQEATIVWHNDELKKAYEQGLADLSKSTTPPTAGRK